MLLARIKRPIVLKVDAPRCPHCESMGWHFHNSEQWSAFLELAQMENVEELVFSLESLLHPEWDEFKKIALKRGFKLSYWLCGSSDHSQVDVSEIQTQAQLCSHYYPLVSDSTELMQLRAKWKIPEGPLHLVFHEEKLQSTLRFFESEIKQDLFPVWTILPERDERRKIGLSGEVLHSLFFKTQGRKWGQSFMPLPGLEMLNLRQETLEDLAPSEIQMYALTSPPKCSLVIPAYGETNVLSKVMEHILKLKNKNFEVIFVDEGNKENLKNFFEQYLGKGLQGTYLRLNWSGNQNSKAFRAGRARNWGAYFSRGEILCFIDSDILLPENYLTEVELALNEHDLSQAVRLDLKATIDYWSVLEEDSVSIPTYWQKFKNSASQNWENVKHPWKYICTHSLSIKRSLFLEMGGMSSVFNRYGYEDTDFGFRAYQNSLKFKLLPTPVCQLARSSHEVAYKNSHSKRFSDLQYSGSLFLRRHWQAEVATHCHYLFDNRRSRWSKVRVIGQDLLQKFSKQRQSYS